MARSFLQDSLRAALILSFATTLSLRAEDLGGDPAPAAPAAPTHAETALDAGVASTPPSTSQVKTSFEADADASYVGGARTNFGRGSKGDVSEQDTDAHFVVTPQWGDGPIYRFGLGYQRFSFGLSQAAPLPNTLQSADVIIGADFSLFNSCVVRVEAEPGLYGDLRRISAGDFNVPFEIGGSYIASAEVQWVLGVGVNLDRRWPVFPDLGLRWAFANRWTLDAMLPSPRLEYEWSKDLSLYAGGDFQDGTYRVARRTGNATGEPRLNRGLLEYDEIRVGAGFSWKVFHGFTLEMEGGYLPYRQFDFERAHLHYGNENGAAYGQVSLNAQF